MGTLDTYRQIVQQVLAAYAELHTPTVMCTLRSSVITTQTATCS